MLSTVATGREACPCRKSMWAAEDATTPREYRMEAYIAVSGDSGDERAHQIPHRENACGIDLRERAQIAHGLHHVDLHKSSETLAPGRRIDDLVVCGR